MAFSEKIKLVSADWVTACVIQGEILDTDEYMVKGIVLGNKQVVFKNFEVKWKGGF